MLRSEVPDHKCTQALTGRLRGVESILRDMQKEISFLKEQNKEKSEKMKIM
jgi:hypothetical protein